MLFTLIRTFLRAFAFFLTFFGGRSLALSWVWRKFSWAAKTTRSHASVNREFPNCLSRFIMCSCSISFLLVYNLHDEASSARFFHDNVKLFTSSEKSICVAVWPFPTFRVGMTSLRAPPILVRLHGNFVSGEKQKNSQLKAKGKFPAFSIILRSSFENLLKLARTQSRHEKHSTLRSSWSFVVLWLCWSSFIQEIIQESIVSIEKFSHLFCASSATLMMMSSDRVRVETQIQRFRGKK